MSLFHHDAMPELLEQLDQLRAEVRRLEFLIAKNPAKLDVEHEALVIGGLSYSLRLFDGLGSFLPIGAVFELVDRAGGSITIRQLLTEIDIRRTVKALEEREEKRRADFAALDSGLPK